MSDKLLRITRTNIKTKVKIILLTKKKKKTITEWYEIFHLN